MNKRVRENWDTYYYEKIKAAKEQIQKYDEIEKTAKMDSAVIQKKRSNLQKMLNQLTTELKYQITTTNEISALAKEHFKKSSCKECNEYESLAYMFDDKADFVAEFTGTNYLSRFEKQNIEVIYSQIRNLKRNKDRQLASQKIHELKKQLHDIRVNSQSNGHSCLGPNSKGNPMTDEERKKAFEVMMSMDVEYIQERFYACQDRQKTFKFQNHTYDTLTGKKIK